MQVSDIISYAKKSSYSENADISDSTIMMYLNIEYHKFAQLIKDRVRSDFFYDVFTTDIIANQNEYSFEWATAVKEGMDHILSVDMKEWDIRYRMKYRSNTSDNKSLYDRELYWSHTVDIKDSSLFIYPTPTHDVVDGLRVQAITTLKDLLITDTESAIYPWHSELRPYHSILWVWLRTHIFQMQGMYNEKIDSINEYDREIEKILDALKWRYRSAVTQPRQDLSYYAN